jgi:hypothetical protein
MAQYDNHIVAGEALEEILKRIRDSKETYASAETCESIVTELE